MYSDTVNTCAFDTFVISLFVSSRLQQYEVCHSVKFLRDAYHILYSHISRPPIPAAENLAKISDSQMSW